MVGVKVTLISAWSVVYVGGESSAEDDACCTFAWGHRDEDGRFRLA
jgi:hypothetical protein